MKQRTCGEREVTVYEASKECAVCKGACCKGMACHYAPNDFGDLSFAGLKAEIEKGCISIDWWEADGGGRQYYLRARHVGAPIVDGSWGGRCVHLTDKGCGLTFAERPTGGKALRPRESKDDDCVTSYSKKDCKEDWDLHRDVLVQLAVYFRSHKQEEVLDDCVCGCSVAVKSKYLMSNAGWGKSYDAYWVECERCGRRSKSFNTIDHIEPRKKAIDDWNEMNGGTER